MTAIVICTLNAKCLPVLLSSIVSYVPSEITIYLSGSHLKCPGHDTFNLPNTASNFGDAYNAVIREAFKTHQEVVVANDDIVLTPTSWAYLLDDVQTLRSPRLGWVACRADYARGAQNIRFSDQPLYPAMRYAVEAQIIEVPVIAPIFAWIARTAWLDFPPLNWFSDDIQCADMRAKGLQHFISRSYVHHVGSQTYDLNSEQCHAEARSWIERHRPEFVSRLFKSPPIATLDHNYQQALNQQNQGQYAEAIAAYETILKQNPEYAPAWYQLGVILANTGQTEQAILAYQKALSLNANYAEAYNNLGILAVSHNELEAAITYFQQAINSNSDYAFAHNNLGLALQMQGKFTEAGQKFQDAITKNPDYADAHCNLGVILESQQATEAAIAQLQTAIRLKPNQTKAYKMLGSLLMSLAMAGETDTQTTRAIYQQWQAVQPNSLEPSVYLFSLKQWICDWSHRESELNLVRRQISQEIANGELSSISPFEGLVQPWEKTLQQQIALIHGQTLEKQWFKKRQTLSFNYSRSLNKKLRIGYISYDFRNHATSHLMRSLFSLHDRDHFEIFAYSLGPDDHSDCRQQIAATCDFFKDIANLPTEDIAQLIFNDRIDILVNLNGYTKGSRSEIFALRPAPIQVNYLGYPGTMGASFMDYFIGDAIASPPHFADDFTEKLVILPHSYQVNDHQQIIDSTPITRADQRLPNSSFVYCCFNNTYKIEPTIFEVWMNILAANSESVLWLLTRYPEAQINLRRQAEKRGISGDRLIFADYQPKPKHLARHRLANLFLDTYYCNAHTTASDALWAGLPVLTCPGETFASRVAASLLTAVGLPELITPNLEVYQTLAIELGRSPQKLTALKQKLAANRTTYPLFDTPRFTRNLEKAYQAMARLYSTNKVPEMIIIEDT
jgi:predicted O-linked N-acetylglucosamine transferase (SPINDLY family)